MQKVEQSQIGKSARTQHCENNLHDVFEAASIDGEVRTLRCNGQESARHNKANRPESVLLEESACLLG